MQQPFIFKLESGNSEVLDNKPQKEDVLLSSTINLPLNSLGFHTFLHRTKKALDITRNMQSKNEIFYIVNPFELTIPNYEDSLSNLTKHYLSTKSDFTSRDFYKFWEMLFLFGIAEKNDMTCVSIGNNPDNINNRSLFYTAQSYRDCSKFEESAKWYNLYLKIKITWIEEEYYSYLQLGYIYRELKYSFSKIEDMYISATKLIPDRAEAYLELGIFYNQSNK